MLFPEEDILLESEVVEVTSETLYCLCREPWDKNNKRFMIQCDYCRDWYHGTCVGLAEYLSQDIDKYHCPKCEPMAGPSMYHEANDKPIQAGTPIFILKLKEKAFPTSENIIVKMRGQSMTLPNLLLKGFSRPILVENVHGLDIKVPADTFTVSDVEKYVGSDRVLDVIDAQRQKDFKMTMKEFVEYFTSPNRTKLYNLISLEFSETGLSKLVDPPYIARKLDWVISCWPKDNRADVNQKPVVSKYCLISSKDSYTDFHVDFGGTSVWYHILWGEKVFYLIEPTPANLELYSQWMSSTTQYESFFADMVDKCYRCILKKGQTLFIPTGWIHAVLTPKDSLVFGGNFLHFLNMDLQLKVYEIEKSLNVPPKYTFPSFEATHWYAADRLVYDIQSLNSTGSVPRYLLHGLKALLNALKAWSEEKDIGKNRREPIPTRISTSRILKQLSREVKASEKRFGGSGNKKETDSPSKKILGSSSGKEKSSEKCNGISNTIVPILPQGKDPLKVLISRVSATGEVKCSPSSSPHHNQQGPAPIKLKLKMHPSFPINELSPLHPSTSSNHSMAGSEINGEDKALTVDTDNVSPTNLITPSSHSPIPKDVKLKMRLSTSKKVNDTKPEFMDTESNTGSDALYIVESDRDELKIDTEGSVVSSDEVRESRVRSSKSHKKHRHKSKCRKKQNALRHRNIDINAELAGTLSGIDELIKTSNYTERITKFEGMRPKMKEVIAGMLSINDVILPLKKRQKHKKKKAKTEQSQLKEDDLEDSFERVHQDDDYVYLPLTGGSDDEGVTGKGKKRGRQCEEDEAWSPRIKVGHVGQRQIRPPRINAKREAVEKGLEKAAAKLATMPPSALKRKYKARKPKPVDKEEVKEKEKEIKVKSSVLSLNTSLYPQPGPSSALGLTGSAGARTAGSAQSTAMGVPRKPKKGMATPKQRLGKILGISKFSKF